MSNLDEDIKRALANGDATYDFNQEDGVFRQMAAIYHGKLRWTAIFATIEGVIVIVLMVLAGIEFFQTDETCWQIFYATGIVLLGLVLLLVKIWGWMQMNRYAIHREIKRLELRILELDARNEA